MIDRPPGTARAVTRFGWAVWSIVLCCSVGIIAHRVIADDQWWHIATGRLILAKHAIPDRDPFSFTYHGQRWINWEWFFGVIVATLWDRLGISGLYLLRAVTTGVCVIASAVHMLRGATRTARTFGLLLLGLVLLCMQYRVGDRPHTIGFALLAVTFLSAAIWLEQSSWWRAIALFASFVVWANTHPSFVYGLLVLASMLLDATVDDVLAVRAGHDTSERAWSRLRRRVLQLLLIGSAALSIPHALEHFRRIGTTLADPVSSEWTSIALHATHGHPWMYAFFLQLALWLASLTVDRRARRSALTLLIAALAVLAFVYSRFVVEFAIVASVVTYRSLLPIALGIEHRLRVRPILLQALLGLCAIVAIEAETRHTYGGLAFGLDLLGNPVSQSDFLQKQGMRGRVFAPGRGDSAYLSFRLWPDVLIYIDGRVPQVFPVAFAERSAHLAEPEVFAEIVARYDVDHVVIDKGTFSAEAIAWAERLEKLGGFALVYFDERGMVWTRERATGLACKSCRAFRRIKPWRTDHEWIVNEFRKQPFDEVWSELSYLTQITHNDRVVRALIATLLEDGGAQEPERERLKVLLASGTH